MGEFRVLEIKQSVFADNDRRADEVRSELKAKKVFLLNLMSSPGSGKTTTLTRTIEQLKGTFRIGVMEADIDSDVDSQTISALGVKAIQLHTGGMCHLNVPVFDKDGKFNPAYDENDTLTIECDRVIFAIGQQIVWGDLLKGTKVEFGRGN